MLTWSLLSNGDRLHFNYLNRFKLVISFMKGCLIDFSLGIWKLQKYKTLILLVVLYGCEAWSLTLKKDRRIRVLEAGGEFLSPRGMRMGSVEG